MKLIRAIKHCYYTRQIKKLLKKKIKIQCNIIKQYDTCFDDYYGIIFKYLSKAVPVVAPYFEDDDGDDYYGRPIIRKFYKCPKCNNTITHTHYSYCGKCGQKLTFKEDL